VGYSAGSRSCPKFDWAKNLLSKKLAPGEVEAIDFDTTSICALFWNLIRTRLPDDILEDFDDFLQRTGIVRMGGNPALPDTSGVGEYAIGLGVGSSTCIYYRSAELAPPTAVFGSNYSR
jgi:hypothetical protein